MAGATPPGSWRGMPWRDDADADQVIQSPWRFSLPGPTVPATTMPVPVVAASAQAPTPRTVVRRGTSAPFAYADGSAVVIERDAATGERRSGGTRAWRNNNPGNLVSSAFATTNGSIGAAAGFAVFPDSASGAAALTALLQTATYQALTVGNAINRYAPPSENDTANYTRIVEQEVGVPETTAVSALTSAQLQGLVNAIRRVEGWTDGQVESLRLVPPTPGQ